MKKTLVLILLISLPTFLIIRYAAGTGGVFPNTEHGGTDARYPDRASSTSSPGSGNSPDGVTGVNRGRVAPYYSGFYEDSSNTEAGRYQSGECNHCHEPHTSFGGEPVPNWGSHGAQGAGPDKYLLFADYDDKWTRTELCGFCHQETDPDANGTPNDTPYDYSFKGVTRFQGTAHFAPPGGRNPVQWPGGQYGSNYPAKSSSDAGTCVNCHSPHGYPYSSSEVAAGAGTPYPKQLVELADISNKNPSTSPITSWPNVSGRDPVDAEDLCFTCHDGSPVTNKDLTNYNSYWWGGAGFSGYSTDIKTAFSAGVHHPVNDSEQSGRTSYYHAEAAKQINVHNAVECTTCHNPHLASGRWDDASSVNPSPTPIVLPGVTQGLYLSNPATYPYQWPPFSWGLSYQPGDLWGDDPEEKINSLLTRYGCGTGGWQFNIDRGYAEGATGLPCDQRPKYQPPLGGTGGVNYEPDGDSLPDYITFCLDCHQHKVGTHMPIYWGAGFPPGVNSGQCDGAWPYDCVTASGWEPHGFDAANDSPFACCDVAGWKACDDIETNTLTPFYGQLRGRGRDVWTKWPYEMADRIAGVNFVLSCTNCHEPHGSPKTSLMRGTINQWGTGGGNDWKDNLCSACHWVYGGEMTYNTCTSSESCCKGCATASCHLTQSLHRMDKNDVGGGTWLYTAPCPNDPVTFDMSSANDSSGKLQGTAYNGALSGGWFVGNGKNASSLATYIKPNSDGYHSCLLGGGVYSSGNNKYASSMTLETRISTYRTGTYDPNGNGLDNEDYPFGYSASTSNDSNWRVIFSRHDAVGVNYSLQFFRPGVPENTSTCVGDTTKACYPGFNSIPDRRGSIAFKAGYYSATAPNWYERIIVTDFNACPLTNDHYYKIRVVYDKNASVSGHAPPGNIYMDDQGTNGAGAGELWANFRNCTDADQSLLTPANTRCCPTCLYTDCAFAVGDVMQVSDIPDPAAPAGCKRAYTIGLDSSYWGINYYTGGSCTPNYPKVFNASIDYITWKKDADYSGIDVLTPP